MRTTVVTVALAGAILLFANPAAIAAEPCEAKGAVVDSDGNPVRGAVLTFTPRDNSAMSYTGKTNKKGRYFIPGMFASQGDEWRIAIEAEGLVAVEMVVESRTVNKVLVGDIYTQTVSYTHLTLPTN